MWGVINNELLGSSCFIFGFQIATISPAAMQPYNVMQYYVAITWQVAMSNHSVWFNHIIDNTNIRL